MGVLFCIGLMWIHSILVDRNLLSPSPESLWNPQWSSRDAYLAFNCLYISEDNLDLYHKYYPWDMLSVQSPSDVCVYDRESGEYHRLTKGDHVGSPIWAADGRKLYWLSGGEMYIWDADDKTTTSHPVANSTAHNANMQLSLDEKYMLMHSDGSCIDLLHWEWISSPVESLHISSDELAWSGDGKMLAYIHYPQGREFTEDDQAAICIREGRTAQCEWIDRGYPFTIIRNLLWSPGNPILLFIGYRGFGLEPVMFLYHAEKWEKMVYPLDADWSAYADIRWSNDGGKLAYYDGMTLRVLKIFANESSFDQSKIAVESYKISGIGGSYDWYNSLSWSSNGRYIAIGAGHNIWIVDRQNTEIRPLISGLPITFQYEKNSPQISKIVE
jgi:hypothetical protein